MHQYTKSSHVQALSIYHQQCQRNKGKRPDRKHILALLSSFTREEVDVKREQIEELCCFDRMKKLIGTVDQLDQEGEKNQIRSIVIEQKINQMENKLNKQLTAKPVTPKSHQRAASSGNFHRKSLIIDSLKKDCLKKFVAHQVGKRDKDIDDARKMIDKEVNSQINTLIEDKGLQMMKVKEENENLKKRILALNLEVQGLKVKQAQMKEYIEELQEIWKGRKETKKTLSQSQTNESFQDKFRQMFGDCTIEQIRRRLDQAIDKCLSGFQRVENRNQIVMAQQKKNFQQQYSRMQKKIDQLQENQNQLLGNLRTLKLNKQLSQVQADELVRAKIQLQSLQKLILALYTEWYADREEGEKKLLKARGCLHENYSYEEMLKYIVEYNKKYSTDQKLNDYLFKVLRGIQKLRRTIYPQQCNEKLDPLMTLDRIEKWVKLRVQVPTLVKKSTSTQNFYTADQ